MATFWLPTVPDGVMFGNRTVAEIAENRGEMSTEVHEEIIEAPPEDVWGFMVDPAALSAWFGADAWLEPEPGGVVRFRFAGGLERRGRVEHVAPFRTLTWRWREPTHGRRSSMPGNGRLLGNYCVRGPTQPIAPYRAINYSAEVSL